MEHHALDLRWSLSSGVRQMLLVLPATLVLTALACGDVTSPVIDPASVDLEFTYRIVRTSDPAGIAVDGGKGSLAVRGSFFAGNGGYELRAEFMRRDKGYELAIIADALGGLSIPVHYRYEAILRDLPAGRYALLVMHRIPDEDTQDFVAFDGHVEVK